MTARRRRHRLRAGLSSVVIPAGTTSRAIRVPVVGDSLVEQDETFHVHLASPNGATLANADALMTIHDDHAQASLPEPAFIAIARPLR